VNVNIKFMELVSYLVDDTKAWFITNEEMKKFHEKKPSS
jgi:hypothetical protein